MVRRELLVDDEAATRLTNSGSIIWYQRYHLSPNVITPGVSDIEAMLDMLGVPQDLTGLSVLDVGTSNGGAPSSPTGEEQTASWPLTFTIHTITGLL